MYKDGNWSKPYFKDSTLENSFNFEDIDTSYSITSESELSGQQVVRFYSDGELNISGEGPLIVLWPENVVARHAPWNGFYHTNEWEYDSYDEDLYWFLMEEVKTIVIGEGITSIPKTAISEECGFTSITFPNSIEEINEYAFYETNWIRDLYNISGYDEDDGWLTYVDIHIGNKTFKLQAIYVD